MMEGMDLQSVLHTGLAPPPPPPLSRGYTPGSLLEGSGLSSLLEKRPQSGGKVKTSLRKSVSQQLRQLFDVPPDETLPAEHVNEALLFLFEEMTANPDLKARFWQHMSEAKRHRESIHTGPAAKRQRRYRQRQREKLRKQKEKMINPQLSGSSEQQQQQEQQREVQEAQGVQVREEERQETQQGQQQGDQQDDQQVREEEQQQNVGREQQTGLSEQHLVQQQLEEAHDPREPLQHHQQGLQQMDEHDEQNLLGMSHEKSL